MKKADFISLLLGTVGTLLFGIGMCMCLLRSWDAFREGVALGGTGLALLLVMLFVRRKMLGKPAVKVSLRTVGGVLLGTAGALTLGVGMCMTMVWEGLLFQGILVGVAGVALLLCLIPYCKGLQ